MLRNHFKASAEFHPKYALADQYQQHTALAV
jgi:hypothetical protein